MGDLVGEAVEGTLYYIAPEEFRRIREAAGDRVERTAAYADMCRLNALYMIARAGSGHIGSSFSSLDIVSWLLLDEMNADDVYFSSKGHDAPGFYAALLGLERLPFDLLHQLRRLDGLPGHPDVATPGIVTNTGSLGMGISKAKGMVLANRLAGRDSRVFVMTGDGELQEGQFWESLVSGTNFGLHEIVVIVDHNKLQSDTFVKNVSDLGDLEAKLAAFGWVVGRCSGHDIAALDATLRGLEAGGNRPKIIIADTVKGRGVSFMEHTSLDSDVAMYRFHSGAPDAVNYRRAAQELLDRIGQRLAALGAAPLAVETVTRPATAPATNVVQRMIPAYSAALLALADRHPELVALDADLILDTGLIPFREKHPDRFIECGIAEQDMVSMAGGMALNGLTPVVHSFACFLSSRPNEQIYNNATEHTRVVYVGSLAGAVPGGPGHSHQAVRDISSLAGVPGMVLLEPSCEAEVAMALDYCVETHPGPSYLRLVSIPCDIPYALPAGYTLRPGRGVTLTEGRDALLIAYGPVMLPSAWRAARKLAADHGIGVTVVNLPWLNLVDADWLAGLAADFAHVVTIDNHYITGGQGDRVAAALATSGLAGRVRLHQWGLTDVPPCGTNDEILRALALDPQGIADRVVAALRTNERAR